MEKVKINLGKILGPRGERGPQGIQGDSGFSPVISVEKDTDNEFILRITNKNSSFLTPNLKNNLDFINLKNDVKNIYSKLDEINQRLAEINNIFVQEGEDFL